MFPDHDAISESFRVLLCLELCIRLRYLHQ